MNLWAMFGMPHLDKLALHLKNLIPKKCKNFPLRKQQGMVKKSHTSHFENEAGDS